MPKRSVQTTEGEVEYDTVVCSSCGDEMTKQGTARVVIGQIKEEGYWRHKDSTNMEFEGRPHKGWLCDVCHETPTAYPHKDDGGGSDNGRLYHLAKIIKGNW